MILSHSILRKHTKQVMVGGVAIGGTAPIVIQSMTNTKTTDVEATLAQIARLKDAGCKIARVTVPTTEDAAAFKKITAASVLPVVADIHFDYRLAIAAIEAGAAKIRINPGNIGSRERVKAVVDAAKAAHIPIRVGVNAGSLEKSLLEKHGGPTPAALAESAQGYIRLMEELGFSDLVLSIKASDILTTVGACRILAQVTDIPQHIGITEAGTVRTGSIRSGVGLGILLADGIGDTLRVSLSGDPVEEIVVAKEILKSLGLAEGPQVIACPTCGRTQIGAIDLAVEVEKMVAGLDVPIKIAVMGCVVNGPGEAREADVGIAGGVGEGLIFMKGQSVEKVPEAEFLSKLKFYIDKVVEEKKKK